MFRYFIRNRHGAISVMLAIVLTAVLAMGSTLLEIARYRSLERLYKEVAENAAFSILAHYDRDLYKNFGLLGVQQDVAEEELRQYLEQNLMGLGSGMQLNGADALSSGINEVELEKLYDLTQKDVFRSQIAEFSAYRAPISIINNGLDIEETLKELDKKLKESMPILELFLNISTVADTFLDAVIKTRDYVESSINCQSAMEEYVNKVNSYNAAISELNSYKDDHEDGEEGYQDALEGYLSAVSENAADLQEKIADLVEALKDLDEKQTAYAESFQAMTGANLKAQLSNAKNKASQIDDPDIKKESLKLIKDMENGYKEGENTLKGVYDKLKQGLSNFQFGTVEKDLEEQSAKVSGSPQELQQIEPVSKAAAAASPMWGVFETTILLGGELIESINSMTNAIEMIKECAGIIGLAATGGVFDPYMNHSIAPPYSSLSNVENPYAAEDALRAEMQKQEISRIAGSLGYTPSFLQTKEDTDMLDLANAMDALQKAETDFRSACQSLGSSGLIGILTSLKQMVTSIISFLTNLIQVINIFTSKVLANLEQMIYQKLYASVYATEMFSNRITDKNVDKRLNGSSFFGVTDLADTSKCFVKADAEYIFCGTNNEILNQSGVFAAMSALRMVCNIPTVLTDSEFMEILGELASIPVIGWIADILLVLTKVYLEAWADMLFMIYAKTEVPIIKFQGYFALDGSGMDELESKVKELIKKQAGHLTEEPEKKKTDDSEKKTDDSDFAQDYVDGLFEWGYKDHLLLMTMFFTSREKIYIRCANLIELELQQKKAKDGAPQEFKLNEMATYIRVETEAEYTPLLPVPTIPGLNSNGLKIDTMHYSGY